LEGERKQVTVLFADLKGSMELLADRDPEEARKILDPVLERMMDAVHRYEGTVNQVMGDGIMALFGAPLAHEDHAVRACYAALRMQESVKRYADIARRTAGVPIHIRVGVNSGEVVVRSIGSDLHMDYTAVGQTTHLAARMEQLADPGAIVIAPNTLALAEGYVEVKSLGPVPVKGLADAIEVYSLTSAGSARTRLQRSARRGLSQFVGRAADLEQLRRAQQLASDSHGQVVGVIGEPGVGKSRLFWEFTHSHQTQGWLVLDSGSVSYGKATPYLPVIDMLKAYFKVQDGDSLREIRENVTGRVLTLDRLLEPTLPALLSLLDVLEPDPAWRALAPPQRRQRTLEAVKRLLLRASQVQPLLVVVEDLHWIDGETQELLNSVIESLPAARVLLLVNYRPEYQHAWGSKTYYTQLRLDALPAESARELLAILVGTQASLESLKQMLIERTGGNPFFLEESVRSLVETKALVGDPGRYRVARPLETIPAPTSVQSVLAARIDRLSPEDKRLLQVASVIGKDIPLAILRAIAELSDERLNRGLEHLQTAEFIYETGLYPEVEYSFKHALTQEVTYGGLLQERRRSLHGQIVDATETLYRDRLGEHIERLAHHALRGELQDKAVQYLRQAGNKAAARSAPKDARVWFEQALGVLAQMPDSRSTLEQAFDIRLELRPVVNQLGEVVPLASLREAEALAEHLNDDRRRGRVSALLTNAHSMLGDPDEALAAGSRALEIAERLGDLRLRIASTTTLEQTHYYRGDYMRVLALATDNLAMLPADWIYEYLDLAAPASVYDRCWLVMSLAELGRFAEAAVYEAEAIRLAEPTHSAFTIGMAYQAVGTLHLLKGDWVKARSLIERGIARVRTGNVVNLLHPSVALSAWALAQLDCADEALSRLREGEQLLERQAAWRRAGRLWRGYHSLGRACLRLGRLDEAQRLADRAVESLRSQFGIAAHALHLLGDIASHPERFDAEQGETYYRQALALAEPRGMRPLVAHCHLGLGNLYRRTGKREQAHEHLTTATTMYREMGMTYWLEKVQAEFERA
jgi:class 3 adenylate cyclase/tetratricopeptide (TPR) repeat protein